MDPPDSIGPPQNIASLNSITPSATPSPTGTTIITTPIDSLNYNMCHKSRGLCLILEHETFDPRSSATNNLMKRIGSNVDSEALVKTFTGLGFEIVLRRDLTGSKLKALLKEVSNFDHTNCDCLVCFVLTHGDHGSLYAYDTRYPVDKLFNYFTGNNCPTLIGKPKLFFIQACQGERFDRGVMVSADAFDSAQYFKIPTHADFLISYSTLPGFASFRNTQKGSWFIQSLVQVLNDYYLHMDLLSMMTIVSHRIAYYCSSKSENPAEFGSKQIPCISSMLTRRVFLFPKPIQV